MTRNFMPSFPLKQSDIERIVRETNKEDSEKLNELKKLLENYIEESRAFRRKLTRTITEMYSRQEMTLDVYDKLKEFLDE